MNEEALKVLMLIADVHRLLCDHSSRLDLETKVQSVAHWNDVISLPSGVAVQEFVDATVSDEVSYSWQWYMSITRQDVQLEAQICRDDTGGQTRLITIAELTFEDWEACSLESLKRARDLCSYTIGSAGSERPSLIRRL